MIIVNSLPSVLLLLLLLLLLLRLRLLLLLLLLLLDTQGCGHCDSADHSLVQTAVSRNRRIVRTNKLDATFVSAIPTPMTIYLGCSLGVAT